MAGRFLIQEISSQMSRPRSLFSAAARAGAPAPAARCFNAFPCPHATTKTNYSTTSMPSVKPACVDSSGGAKESFSSTASMRRNAKMAEWDAKTAARQARFAAWEAEMDRKSADFNKFIRNQVWLWGLAGSFSIIGAIFGEENGTSSCNVQAVDMVAQVAASAKVVHTL